MFKIIIAGSRDFNDYELLVAKCDKILGDAIEPICIVSGGARGADKLGERYALERGYQIKQFIPDWEDIEGKPKSEIKIGANGKPYWTKAGLERNSKMAEYANALISFSLGTPGTRNMIETARRKGLRVREIKL